MSSQQPNREIHSKIYHKLLKVIPDLLTIKEAGKSVVENYMDLNLDILHRGPDRIVIALSHYYQHPSGDMIADPDMAIRVSPLDHSAEALSYQDIWGYRQVYVEDGIKVDVKAKRELNWFLSQWLSNLIKQGHCVSAEDETDQ